MKSTSSLVQQVWKLLSIGLTHPLPAKQIGWMSQFGEKLALPITGQGTATCSATGLRYQLQNDELTVQEK